MQYQVHVLSVFDRISFKYWLFVPQTGLTQRHPDKISTSSSGHCPVEFLLQHNNNINLAFQCQKHSRPTQLVTDS